MSFFLAARMFVLLSLAAAVLEKDREAWDRLVAWIDESGGDVTQKLYVDSVDGLRGIFTSADIEKGEELYHIPAKNIIHGLHDPCDVVKKLRHEMKLGPDSFYAPLLDMQAWDPSISVPAFWDAADLALLRRTPPFDWSRHKEWYDSRKGSCPEIADDIGLRAIEYYVAVSNTCFERIPPGGKASKGDEHYGCMTPIYGAFNHHNGLQNYRMEISKEGDMTGFASRFIPAGGEIFNSFGEGTPDCFRDYGFVEPQPQKWWFQSGGTRFDFTLDSDKVHFPAGNIPSAFLSAAAAWLRDRPKVSMDRTPEQKKIQAYHRAFIDAVQKAEEAALEEANKEL
jgi:hypothetical protein